MSPWLSTTMKGVAVLERAPWARRRAGHRNVVRRFGLHGSRRNFGQRIGWRHAGLMWRNFSAILEELGRRMNVSSEQVPLLRFHVAAL